MKVRVRIKRDGSVQLAGTTFVNGTPHQIVSARKVLRAAGGFDKDGLRQLMIDWCAQKAVVQGGASERKEGN